MAKMARRANGLGVSTSAFASMPRFEMLTRAVRDRRLRFAPAWVLAVVLGLGGGACVQPPEEVDVTTGEALDICATAPEGALCDDKNVCTIFDVCKAGVCKGSAAPNGTLCTDGNVCTANDSCRAGTCTGDVVPDLTACTDGDPCTVGDACKTGACVPGAAMLACSDGIACTVDLCVPGLGCFFSPTASCPKDGGTDAADAKADTMTVVDAPKDTGAPDVAPSVDAPKDVAPVDAPKDVAPAVEAGTDAPKDVAPVVEAGTDAPKDVGSDVVVSDGGVDARDAAAPDADAAETPDAALDASADTKADAASDAASDADASPIPSSVPSLRASGGACACSAAPSPTDPVIVLVLLLAAGFVLGRRRARRTQ
jgi:MYXO-CTERM domain-containing protein